MDDGSRVDPMMRQALLRLAARLRDGHEQRSHSCSPPGSAAAVPPARRARPVGWPRSPSASRSIATPGSPGGISCCWRRSCSVPRCGPPAWRRARPASKTRASWWWTKSSGQWIALAGARPLNWNQLPGRFRAVSPVRYLEAAAGAAIGSAARRAGHQRRRRDGGSLCGTCVIGWRDVSIFM